MSPSPFGVAVSLLAVALPAAAAAAQDPAPERGDPRAELRAIKKDYNEAIKAWRADAQKKMQEAATQGAPMPMLSMRPPSGPFVKRALARAEQYAGTDSAIGFLSFVIGYASIERDALQKAVGELARSHATSEDIELLLGMVGERADSIGRPQVLTFFGEVIDRNEHGSVLAQAYIARGTLLLKSAETDAERQAARRDLDKVREITDDEDAIAQAETVRFELEHLQVGCQAPEIEGKDTDGVAFKLSDYRGKVVMLEFWGFW